MDCSHSIKISLKSLLDSMPVVTLVHPCTLSPLQRGGRKILHVLFVWFSMRSEKSPSILLLKRPATNSFLLKRSATSFPLLKKPATSSSLLKRPVTSSPLLKKPATSSPLLNRSVTSSTLLKRFATNSPLLKMTATSSPLFKGGVGGILKKQASKIAGR